DLRSVGDVAAHAGHGVKGARADESAQATVVGGEVEGDGHVPGLQQVLDGPGAEAAGRAGDEDRRRSLSAFRRHGLSAHTNLVTSLPSGPTSTTYSSPGFTQSFWVRPRTTPSGVPVTKTSPASKVMKRLA